MISSFKAVLLLAAVVAADDDDDPKNQVYTYAADTAYLVYANSSAAATSMQSNILTTDGSSKVNLTSSFNMTRQYDFDKTMDAATVWNCQETPMTETTEQPDGTKLQTDYIDYVCIFAAGTNFKDGDGTIVFTVAEGSSKENSNMDSTEPRWDTLKQPQETDNNNLQEKTCTIIVIKTGDKVTQNYKAANCGTKYYPQLYDVSITGNSFNAAISYVQENMEIVDVTTYVNNRKADFNRMQTGAWFSHTDLAETENSFVLQSLNKSPFYDTADSWVFPVVETGSAALGLAAVAVAVSAIAF